MNSSAISVKFGILLPKLQAVFHKLQAIEGTTNIDWQTLLEQREAADPLTDDAWLRGYLVGVADALGISAVELLEVIRTKPRRRIVEVRRAG